MDAALGLLRPGPPPRALVLPFANGARARLAPDGEVASLLQRMLRDRRARASNRSRRATSSSRSDAPSEARLRSRGGSARSLASRPDPAAARRPTPRRALSAARAARSCSSRSRSRDRPLDVAPVLAEELRPRHLRAHDDEREAEAGHEVVPVAEGLFEEKPRIDEDDRQVPRHVAPEMQARPRSPPRTTR